MHDPLEGDPGLGIDQRRADARSEALRELRREIPREVALRPRLILAATRASALASRSRPSRGGSIRSANEFPFTLGSNNRSSRRMCLLLYTLRNDPISWMIAS